MDIQLKIKKLFSAFNRGHAAFTGGSALVVLFPIISLPILSRLYSPSDFGAYAVFYALVTILSAVSTFSMSNAILLESEPVEIAHATFLSICLAALFSVMLLLLELLIPFEVFSPHFEQVTLGLFIWIPATVFFAGAYQALYLWATKEQQYRLLAKNKIFLGLMTALMQVGIGLAEPGPIGFVIANLLGLMLAFSLLAINFYSRAKSYLSSFKFVSWVKFFKKHYLLPLWTMPATLVNTFSSNLPDLLIGKYFGPAQLGQYSIANRMLNFPISFLASSLQDIFKQQAADEFEKFSYCRKSFIRFFVLLTSVSLLIIVPLVFVVPYLFPIILGPQWVQSGYLVQAVAFLVVLKFISGPLSYIWIISGNQRADFIWQIGLLVITFFSLSVEKSVLLNADLYSVLLNYSLAAGAWYAVCIVISFYFSGTLKWSDSAFLSVKK